MGRGDSCTSPWLTRSQTEDLAAGSPLCAHVRGRAVTGWASRAVLLTLVPIFPVVSETEKVPPCQCKLGGGSGSFRAAFCRREGAGRCSGEGRRPSPFCPIPKG